MKVRIGMDKLYRLKPHWLLLIFIILDVLCIGMGMGVPIFCILFGFVVGWFLVKLISRNNIDTLQALRKVLQYGLVTSGITFVGMGMLWLPFGRNFFDPAADLAQTGIPMILYEPRPSFIGWMVLMVLISPFLQLLTTLFSAYVTTIFFTKNRPYDQKAI